MQNIIESFLNIIKTIETHSGYPIKVIAFDFDCTLIPFHTTGCYAIHHPDGHVDPDVLNKFFPNPDLLKGFINGLIKNGIKPAITSHSDQRFNSTNIEGLLGGSNLILPLLQTLFDGNEIFNESNVIAFSHPTDGSFTHKNIHIKKLVQNINDNNVATENVLLIDDTIHNILKTEGFQSLYSNFKGTGLSFGCDIDMIKIYVNMLKQQVDTQIKENYGFTIKQPDPEPEIEKKPGITSEEADRWLFFILGAIMLVFANKVILDVYNRT